MLVGHSTGGGEVTRYLGRHGTTRIAKAVLVAAVPPMMLKTEAFSETDMTEESWTVDGVRNASASPSGAPG